MQENDNPREELYQAFKAALSQPLSERYFDEDVLVDVYDYAGDLSDDYIQLEVLFCGARFYPDSVPLAERRALLYLDTTDDESGERTDAAKRFIEDNSSLNTPLMSIASAQVNGLKNPESGLDFLLSQIETLDDEETIRFIELASQLDCNEWLTRNYDKLASKCDNKLLLNYELAQEADNRGDNEELVRLADMLIEAEPFTVGYWILLLRGQARLNMQQEARTTFDYAKALATDNPQALLALAEVVYTYAQYLLPEIVDAIGELATKYPDEFVYTDCYCALLSAVGRTNIAITTLKRYLDTRPGDTAAVRQLLLCSADNVDEYLARYYAKVAQGEQTGFLDEENFADALLMRGAYVSIDAMLKASSKIRPIDSRTFATWFEAKFAMGKYDEIVELYETESGQTPSFIISFPFKGVAQLYLYIVSLIKIDRFEDALTICEKTVASCDEAMRTVPLPVRMTLQAIEALLNRMRIHPAEDKLFWQYYDPYKYAKL